MAKRLGLGKGLSALIPEGLDTQDKLFDIDVDLIDPNPDQPRSEFNPDRLEELAESIRNNGVIQPIIVTKTGKRYTLIAGERRWRAAQLAGYHKIPAIIRTVADGEMLTLSLLENIQREELNPIEEARAYRNLIETQNFTHDSMAAHLGKSRAAISNTIRLLKLPREVQSLIEDGQLKFGHGKCLITIEDPEVLNQMALTCIEQGWSVRQLEEGIRKQRPRKVAKKSRPAKSVFLRRAEQQMSAQMGIPISIQGTDQKGKIVIPYKSPELLQKIFETITQQGRLEE